MEVFGAFPRFSRENATRSSGDPVNRENDGTGSSAKKKPLFKEIEDVVSIGALLRPTIMKAIAQLDAREVDALRAILIEAEKHLANSRSDFRERFARAQETLVKTYAFAPIWRFIAGRIEDTWKTATTLTVRELSVVSLLFGMMLEETQARTASPKKKSA
jgi:hypothetical protein